MLGARKRLRFRVNTNKGRKFYVEATTARGARNLVQKSIDPHGKRDERPVAATAFADGTGRTGVWTLED